MSVPPSHLTLPDIFSDLQPRNSAKRVSFGDTFGIQTYFHFLVLYLTQISVYWSRTGQMKLFVASPNGTQM